MTPLNDLNINFGAIIVNDNQTKFHHCGNKRDNRVSSSASRTL